MKLFEVLPDGLFQLLTGTNKQIYAEALQLIYEQAQTERFGVRYELMRDLRQEMLETTDELGHSISGLVEEESGSVQDQAQMTLEDYTRSQAGVMLRRMERLKWIDIETRSQFERYIVLPHFASRIIGVLKELCEARTVEYQRFAFLIYQSLTGEAAKLQPFSAVLGAADVTGQFRQELVALYNNMKHHMEQVAVQTTIKDVLDHHFDRYKSQIIDKSYHRLKTSDHVARYRMQIMNTVQQWLLDGERLEEAALDGVSGGMYSSREDAERAVKQALFFIEETFSGLEELFYQIDVRHNQYLRSSYDRARYLSQQNEGIDHTLAEVIEAIRSGLPEEATDKLFALRQVKAISEYSLLTPRRKKPPHEPDVHVTIDIPEDEIKKLRNRNLDRLRKAMTRAKIDEFVLGRMGKRMEMELSELSPSSAEEVIMLGYVYLYGSDGGSGFRIVRSGVRKILLVGGYRFDNHTIARKEG